MIYKISKQVELDLEQIWLHTLETWSSTNYISKNQD